MKNPGEASKRPITIRIKMSKHTYMVTQDLPEGRFLDYDEIVQANDLQLLEDAPIKTVETTGLRTRSYVGKIYRPTPPKDEALFESFINLFKQARLEKRNTETKFIEKIAKFCVEYGLGEWATTHTTYLSSWELEQKYQLPPMDLS